MRQKRNAFILLMLFVVGVLSMNVEAIASTNTSLIYGSNGTITRAEWIHNLVIMFDMTVENKDYPDSYYSDVTSSTSYYDDIMMAVEFGVIDLAAGSEFKPEAQADREFAAYTLNYCLGFITEEGDEYSFLDAEEIEYNEAAQIAIKREWFSLVNDAFMPKQNVTSDEVKAMCEDARTIVADMVIDEYHDNTFTFAEGVIEVPEYTSVDIDENGKVLIYDMDIKIAEEDKFAIYQNGLPVVYIAKTVEQQEDAIRIAVEKTEDGVESMNAEGSAQADLSLAEPIGDTKITYVEAENSGYSSRLGGTVPITELKIDKPIQLANNVKVHFKATVSDIIVKYKINLKPGGANNEVLLTANGKLKATCTGSVTASQSVELIRMPVAGIGVLTLNARISINGEVSLVLTSNVECGIRYTSGGGFQLIRNFTAPNFSGLSEIKMDAGYILRLGTEDIPLINAEIYAQIGVRAEIKSAVYGDGKKPEKCKNISHYLYATAGAKASIKYVDSWSKELISIDETNSPCRHVIHFEDEVHVPVCTRNPNGWYSSLWNSRYGCYGSYGFDEAGEIVPVYTYTLDEDGNATITGYTGKAHVLNIPSEVDAHTVVVIGSKAFNGRGDLEIVTIPDTVTIIKNEAFSSCSNLSTFNFSQTLTTIEKQAFSKCISLVDITLPNSLETVGEFVFLGCNELESATLPNNKKYTTIVKGMFKDCVNLVNINISEYITTIKSQAFYNTGVINLDLSDNITEIGSEAFYGCKKLQKLKLPKYLEIFSDACFGDCDALTSIEIPKKIKENDYYPDYHAMVDKDMLRGMFYDCDNLTDITFEKGINAIAPNLFNGCTGIQEITLPETITSIGCHAFNCCSSLKKVNFPDSLTKIDVMAFRGCNELEEIDIPDSVTEIDCCAFISCHKLKNVHLPQKLNIIGTWAFRDCTALETIIIPRNLESVPGYYNGLTTWATESPFVECTKLKEVQFEKGIKTIASDLFKDNEFIETIVIPDTVTSINSRAFYGATSLESITLSNSLTTIDKQVFYNCKSLETIEIPDTVKSMGDSVFEGCSLLEYIKLPKYRIGIPVSAFKNCTSLTSIEFPESLQYIYDNAFDGCEKLECITVPDTFKAIYPSAFKNCKRLKSIEIKGDVIDSYAFQDCGDLMDVKMSNSIYSIGKGAFKNCSSIETLELSTGITEIKNGTFEGCTSLDNLVIPYGVTKIGETAFKDCTKLKHITILPGVESISDKAFSYPDETTVYGVRGSYAEEYATANNMTFEAIDINAEDVIFSEKEYVIEKGNSKKINVNIIPKNTTNSVEWSSSNNSVATVSQYGTVKGVAIGECTVTVTVGGISKSCNIKVKDKIGVISISGEKEIVAGRKFQLSCKSGTLEVKPEDVIWFSDDSNIAKVDETGLVTAIEKGEVTIIARLKEDSSIEATFKIAVKDDISEESSVKLSSINAAKNQTVYNAGEKLNLSDISVTAIYSDNTTKSVAFSDCTSNAEELDMGTVGDKKLTIHYTENNVEATCDISIKVLEKGNEGDKPSENEPQQHILSEITVQKEKTSYEQGEAVSLEDLVVKAVYSDGSNAVITNYTTNISSLNTMTAGKQTLIVTYYEGGITKTAKVEITVTEKKGGTEGGSHQVSKLTLKDIRVTKEKAQYYVGDTLNLDDLTVTAVYTDGSEKILSADAYTTNKNTVDMSFTGTKYLLVKYTEGGIEKEKSVEIKVIAKPSTTPQNAFVKPAKVTGLKVKAKGSGKISITWKKAKNASKYNVQIATKKNFKSGKKTKTVSARSLTWKKLKKGKTYYVRVRGYNTKSKKYGNWSSIKKVKVK